MGSGPVSGSVRGPSNVCKDAIHLCQERSNGGRLVSRSWTGLGEAEVVGVVLEVDRSTRTLF